MFYLLIRKILFLAHTHVYLHRYTHIHTSVKRCEEVNLIYNLNKIKIIYTFCRIKIDVFTINLNASSFVFLRP